MHEFFWFVGGAAAYKLLSKILGISQVTIVFQTLQYDVLKLLAAAVEDISYIKALKYKMMMETSVDSNVIKTTRMADEQFFDQWKEKCISNIHSSVPSYIRLSFDNWKEGMDILGKYYKGRLHERRKKE